MKSRTRHATVAFALLATLAASRGAFAEPLEAAIELVSRPLVRFMLLHTPEGNALGEAVLGFKPSTDAHLERLARSIRAGGDGRQLRARLEMAESEARAELAAGAGFDHAAARIAARAGEILGTRPGASDAIGIAFTDATDAGGLAAARARFLDAARSPETRAAVGPGSDLSGRDLSSLDLSGRDLRFTRWKDAEIGDLRGSDLAGADLRGAIVDAESSRFEGAIFDQYTALPFGQADAFRRGMVYRPTRPAPGTSKVDADALERSALKSGAAPPADADGIAGRALRGLREAGSGPVGGIELFEAPRALRTQGMSRVSFEAGRILPSHPDAHLAALVREAEGMGVSVHLIHSVNPATGKPSAARHAYFMADRPGEAVLAVSEGTPPATLAHEREHMLDWAELYRKKLARAMDGEHAFRNAIRSWESAEFTAFSERNAIRAQLRAERASADLSGMPLAERPYRHENPDFLSLAKYPEREGLLFLYGEHTATEIRGSARLRRQAEGYMDSILRSVLAGRRQRFERLGLRDAAQLDARELFYEVVNTNSSRFAADGTLDDIERLFKRRLPLAVKRLPEGEFSRLIKARLLGDLP